MVCKKNVQDGISRPLGSREIQKNKSEYSFKGHHVIYFKPFFPRSGKFTLSLYPLCDKFK